MFEIITIMFKWEHLCVHLYMAGMFIYERVKFELVDVYLYIMYKAVLRPSTYPCDITHTPLQGMSHQYEEFLDIASR